MITAMTLKERLHTLSRSIGPGFITGAADDDPSGIATYSQTGALFGYSQSWIALFSYPFMTAMQEMCGRIGLVTGSGLSGVIKRHYSKKILYGAVLLLVIANTINIGADLGAMAASVQLLVPLPFTILLIGITALTLFLIILIPYPLYARLLKYLTLSLLAYVGVALLVRPDWWLVLRSTVIPHIEMSREYILNIAAFLGTTISPYLFFWQAGEEVEEVVAKQRMTEMGAAAPQLTKDDMKDMRIDTALGMLFSNVVAFFIIVAVASTIAISHVETAAEAASALRPIAGEWAFFLFTLGILGTGLLAVPILAGSAAYAVSEAFDWKEGLNKRFHEAHGFYGVIVVATVFGLIVNFVGIPSMTMLYYAAMINGILAPPLMILILLIGNNRNILGAHTNSRLSNTLGVIITAIMSAIALCFLYVLITG